MERTDFRMTQKFYPAEDVLTLLAQIGFQAESFNGSRLGMQGNIGEGRIFFRAIKVDRQ